MWNVVKVAGLHNEVECLRMYRNLYPSSSTASSTIKTSRFYENEVDLSIHHCRSSCSSRYSPLQGGLEVLRGDASGDGYVFPQYHASRVNGV